MNPGLTWYSQGEKTWPCPLSCLIKDIPTKLVVVPWKTPGLRQVNAMGFFAKEEELRGKCELCTEAADALRENLMELEKQAKTKKHP